MTDLPTDVVITAAKRTPVGSFLGAFATTPAHELGRIAIEAALEQAGVAGEDVSEVILGQVLTAAQGQNPARQASMAAGVPKEIPAWGVNQVCGSGLRAVALAAQAIQTGDATIVVAGGQESMSLSAHAQSIRGGQKMGNLALVDTRSRAASRTRSRSPRRTRPRRRADRAASRTRSHPSRSRAARATRSLQTTNTSAPARPSRASRA